MRCPGITLILAIAAASACSGSHRSTTPLADQTVTYTNNPNTPEAQVTPAPNQECPFDVAGADVVAEPLDDGIALVFTTDPEHVGDVRAQVRQFAGPPGADRATMPLADGVHGPQIGGVEVYTLVTDIVDGVRLELRPVDQSKLGELRRQARAKVVALETGSCPTESRG